ncbi:MAG: hypothetical protein FWG16_00035 [Micrococcales bacterium]|nr:hypothetical protein [Micrococcales bacterium]
MTSLEQLIAVCQHQGRSILVLESAPPCLASAVQVAAGTPVTADQPAAYSLVVGELPLGQPTAQPGWPVGCWALLTLPGWLLAELDKPVPARLPVMALSQTLGAWSIKALDLLTIESHPVLLGQVVERRAGDHQPNQLIAGCQVQNPDAVSSLETLNHLVLLDAFLASSLRHSRQLTAELADLRPKSEALEAQLQVERQKLKLAVPKAQRYDRIRAMKALRPAFWLARRARRLRRG